MKRRKRNNAGQTFITRTLNRHVAHDPEVGTRVYERAIEQIGVRNETTGHPAAHGPTAVRTSPRTPNALFALYQQWRIRKPWLGKVLQAVWRPAMCNHTNTGGENTGILTGTEGRTTPETAARRGSWPDPRQTRQLRPQAHSGATDRR